MAYRNEIRTKIGADGRGFAAGLHLAENQAKRWAKRIGGYFAAAFTIGTATRLVKETMRWANETWDAAEAVGITFEEMQKLQYASEKTGASVETMVTAMRKLSNLRTEALGDPKSKAARLMEALGVSREELLAMRGNVELFARFSGIIKNSDFGAAQLSIVNELFGRGATELIPMMKEGFSDLSQEASRLGLIMKNDVGKSLDELGDKFEQLKRRMRAASGGPLGGAADWLSNAIDLWTGKYKAKNVFTSVARGISGGLLGGLIGIGRGEPKSIAEIMSAIAGPGKSEVQKALSQTNYKPASDALARIGGFVGMGTKAIESQQLQELREIRLTVKQLGRFAYMWEWS